MDPLHSMIIGAVNISLKSNAAAIIVTTTTGRSAVLLSMYRPRCPILAVTRYGVVARWLMLYFGIHSLHYKGKYIFIPKKKKILIYKVIYFSLFYKNYNNFNVV